MKTLSWLITLALASSVTETLTFDRATIGKTPSGWTAIGSGGQATADSWKIIKDPSAPTQPYVLAHEPQNGAGGDIPPMAILQRPVCQDGEISVKFKPVAGRQDQDAGLIWRYRDPNNYYVVRADAQEKNVAMYRVANGRPIPLAPRGRKTGSYAVKHLVSSNSWGILKVVFKGPAYSVYYDHRRILQVDDASYTGPGRVGLWTRSDSVTYFDNFHVIRRQ